MDKLPVILLAGSPSKRDALMEYADVDYKVLIKIEDKPLIQYVLDATIGSNIASYILIVGIPQNLVTLPQNSSVPLAFLEMEGESVDKIYNAAKYLVDKNIVSSEGHALYIPGDIPMVTSSIIRDYIKSCVGNFDFYYSLVTEVAVRTRLPTSNWSYMKIRDGKFAAGNLFLLKPFLLLDKYELIKFLTDNRKSFVLGVLKASPLIFLKLIFGRIRLYDAEKLMTKMFKLNSKLMVTDYIEIAFDADRPQDIDFLREYFRNKKNQ